MPRGMKAQKVRAKLQELQVAHAHVLQEQLALDRARDATTSEARRSYHYAVGVPREGFDQTPTFIVEFNGHPDGDVIVQGGGLCVLALAQLQTLTEIVAHVEDWKRGVIDALAPSGVWASIAPVAASEAASETPAAWAITLKDDVLDLKAGLFSTASRPPSPSGVSGQRPVPDIAARIPFDCVTTLGDGRVRLHHFGEHDGRYAECSSLDVAYALHDLIVNAAIASSPRTSPSCGWCQAPEAKGERSVSLLIPWCGHCYPSPMLGSMEPASADDRPAR